LEKFGEKVYSALVENFSQTFFVGGMVRDVLLGREVMDIDIATSAPPEQIIKTLKEWGIEYSDLHKKFGNIIAKQGSSEIEITTLRKDTHTSGRYSQVTFVKTPKADSGRRDFSVNALYLKLNPLKILDFHTGLKDLKGRKLKFIGKPFQRIQEDPLRILRALRFALVLNFRLDNKTYTAIKNNFNLLENLTQSRTQKEIKKITSPQKRKILEEVVNEPKTLDKYFK